MGNTLPIEKNNSRNWCTVIHIAKNPYQLRSSQVKRIKKQMKIYSAQLKFTLKREYIYFIFFARQPAKNLSLAHKMLHKDIAYYLFQIVYLTR